jgi:hypothetical protein
MFVRFRKVGIRLQVSIIETRRINGKVNNVHVASLGSLRDHPSFYLIRAFWQNANTVFARLGNRITPPMQAELISAIEKRVPPLTKEGVTFLKAYDELGLKGVRRAIALAQLSDDQFEATLKEVQKACARAENKAFKTQLNKYGIKSGLLWNDDERLAASILRLRLKNPERFRKFFGDMNMDAAE